MHKMLKRKNESIIEQVSFVSLSLTFILTELSVLIFNDNLSKGQCSIIALDTLTFNSDKPQWVSVIVLCRS